MFEHVHSKKRNRLAQSRMVDLVYIEYNRALNRRYNLRDTIDPISLKDIDDSNEWLTGRVEEEDVDEFVLNDDISTWGSVARGSGVEDERFNMRSRMGPLGRATGSSSSSQHAPHDGDEVDEENDEGYKSCDDDDDGLFLDDDGPLLDDDGNANYTSIWDGHSQHAIPEATHDESLVIYNNNPSAVFHSYYDINPQMGYEQYSSVATPLPSLMVDHPLYSPPYYAQASAPNLPLSSSAIPVSPADQTVAENCSINTMPVGPGSGGTASGYGRFWSGSVKKFYRYEVSYRTPTDQPGSGVTGSGYGGFGSGSGYVGLEASSFASNVNVAPDLRRALSLLSTNSWGLNDSEGNALDQLMHVKRSSVAQPAVHAELQNWDFSSSGHEQVEQPPPESRARSLNFHNNGSGHYQEFQLFKSSYESGCQIN
ncbi:hypothetical protein CMV_006128 [Castanea mollissima]|uniref:Uncharacterized protein n=1 Tax=Castanea mollissima TaxID=60419 RepID=A0A8J4RC16_9ROSI|nr:hypothetical protein CMV_006128 [Castanea mollissima]